MKKLTTLLMTLMLMSAALWADETITVSANSSDISEGLDLKVVAKLFADAKNLEEFETMLNNPDSAFCNLDLNGDGEVDYLRVVETGEGNKRLIVLQAVLAKDIYQDVASIYVEKDEKEEVTVQVVGDEYIYGENYIIEPVYVYRPVIYDWFWSDAWYAWHSPWYWDYWPSWWYAHHCWAHDWYWHHCYAYHHHHYTCSFRYGHHMHDGYHHMQDGVGRHDYANAHPNHSFKHRNSGHTNARDIRRAAAEAERKAGNVAHQGGPHDGNHNAHHGGSPRGDNHTAHQGEHRQGGHQGEHHQGEHRQGDKDHATITRSTSSTVNKPQRPSGGKSSSSSVSTTRTNGSTATRSTSSTSQTRSTSTSSSSRPTSSSSSTSRSTSSSSTSRPSGGSRSSGGSVSRPSGGGSSRPSSGGVSRPGGGGSRPSGGGHVRR